jgi:uncharacterized lipoprotein YmbA
MKTAMRRPLAWAAIAIALAGCAGTPPDRHYRLVLRGEAPVLAAPPAPLPVVAVAAVSVPELVDRPQIVTLGPGSQVFLNEQHRWAEPLKLAIGRLVAERLAATLGGARVTAYPAEAGTEPGYRVSLAVQRFDSEPGVAAHTTVLWTVRRLADGQHRAGRSAQSTQPADASLDALADAHAQALARVADDIARGIAELAPSTR